jgi:hypothetical protein
MLRKLQTLVVFGMSVLATPALAQDVDAPAASDVEAEADAAVETDAEGLAPEPETEVEPTSEEAAPELKAEAGPSASTGQTMTAGETPEGAAEEGEPAKKKAWELGMSGYFRAPIAMGLSNRPGPDNLTGPPELQISYGPNRTVDANYFSFGYTRLQEQDWVELFFHAKAKHVQATVGWMGYWFAAAGFRNPDAAWVPGVAYLTIDTDFKLGDMKPNVALSGGSWWPKFGRFEKYDTFTLGQFRQIGEQLKITLPFTEAFKTTLVQGFGTGRDGSFSILDPAFYQGKVGLNLLHYVHLQFNYEDWAELGLHNNVQWTRDPNLLQGTSVGKSYTNAREASLVTFGGEAKVKAPYAGSLWVSPSVVTIKNGWALGQAGVEVVHGLSPEGLATNYLAWSGSLPDSTGSGTLFNLGVLYENTLSNVLGKPEGGAPEVKVNVFGLLVDSNLDLPDGSVIARDSITSFKWGADAEYNPWKWFGVMLRWDSVNYDMATPGYIFSAITGRLSFYSDFLSGERIYLQYSRYRYGDNMTLAGTWPWGVPLVPGSDIIQGGPYAGSKPDMDVVKIQADIRF